MPQYRNSPHGIKAILSSVHLAVIVADGVSHMPFEALVRAVVAGGADMLQLREKNLPDGELLQHARLCREIARDIIFIVNDRPDIAVLSEANGVHVGPSDLPVAAARRIVGPDALVGASAYTAGRIVEAAAEGADYLGVGAVFPTGTKDAPVAGLPLVKEAARIATVAFLAIGGIDAANVASVVAAGARAVAVSSAVIASPDPGRATASLKETILACLGL